VRTRASPPLCAATWSPRQLARAAPNWMFCVRSLPQPNGAANALDLPMSAHTRRNGPGCRSTGRSVVAATRSATRTGLHVRSKRRCPRPRLSSRRMRVVRPPPRQVLLQRCGPPPIRRSRDVTVGYQPGGAPRRVQGRPRSPGPLARSGRRRRSWQPTAAPPRVRARRRAKPGKPGPGGHLAPGTAIRPPPRFRHVD
jgi:hypothetical protein